MISGYTKEPKQNAMEIEMMTDNHWSDVRKIYEQGIATRNATFQTLAPSWEEWDRAHSSEVRLVAIINQLVVGWAAISPVSTRYVYRGVAEVSVYIDSDFRGKGVGFKLLQALIRLSEEKGFWTLQAGIFPENIASLKIHEHLGFRVVGTREKIGKMDETWRSTMLLERRSAIAGLN